MVMAGPTSSTTSEQPPPCPDPSAHEKLNRMSEQASTAALYVTQHSDKNSQTSPSSGHESVLGPDGKLSSKSAATSLKYAKPEELPSFPVRGVQDGSANAAATLAKDYKMKELWEPSASDAGSKAAMKAHQTGGKLDLWEPAASPAGNSAAVLAMRNTSLSPQIDRGYTATGRSNSLLAATKSHHSGRQRAGSTPAAPPPAYPDSQNSATNALSAATASHRTSTRAANNSQDGASPRRSNTSRDGWSSEANQAARVTHLGNRMKPEMFGEHPPVEPEVEEQKHNAALRASAISMAKQMYHIQELRRHEAEGNAAEAGAGTAHRRHPSLPTQPDLRQEAMQYIHLQEAAHKLAQERLAKVDQDFEAGRYREYWGYSSHQTKHSRLSMRGRRKRASSEGARNSDDSDDEDKARRIRAQMSQLSTGLNAVDTKKKEDDRARLMAAAEARVQARLHDLDEKVFQDTGKVSPAMMEEWEAKARAKAEKDRVERERHPGQTHIGGGVYMSQSEIEAIAAARLQSTFAEINNTAEKRRAHDEQIAIEKDRQQTEKMQEKMNQEHQKAEFKRLKEADKLAAQKEKEDRKAAKKAEQEEARVRKSEEQRKSRDVNREQGAAAVGGGLVITGATASAEHGTSGSTGQQTDLKDKRASRGVFGRIASKLKRRSDGEKAGEGLEATERPSTEGAQPTAVPVVKTDASDIGKHEVVPSIQAPAEQIVEKSENAPVKDEVPSNIDNPYFPLADVSREAPVTTSESAQAENSDHTRISAAGVVATGSLLANLISAAKSKTEPVETRTNENTAEGDESAPHGLDKALEEVETDSDSDVSESYMGPKVSKGYSNPLASPMISLQKPILERHISTIAHSDEDGESGTGLSSDNDEEAFDFQEPVSPLTDQERENFPHTEMISSPKGTDATGATAAPAVAATSVGTTEPTSAMETTNETPKVPVQASTAATTNTARNKSQEKESKGLRGFIGKLRNRGSKPENRLSKNGPGMIPKLNIRGTEPGVATDTSKTKDISANRNVSSSSAQDTAKEAQEHDELYSSGGDEDAPRGRTGRTSNKGSDNNPVAVSAPGPAATEFSPISPTSDQEQFEEARDHFDERLAPAPAFAGQLKSSSPVRETRFQEQL